MSDAGKTTTKAESTAEEVGAEELDSKVAVKKMKLECEVGKDRGSGKEGKTKELDARADIKIEEEIEGETENSDDIVDVKRELDEEKITEYKYKEGKISKLEKDIIRQVEYYFGDANLQRDKFMLELIGKNEGGWIPFSVLLTFKRLAALSTDIPVIVDALMKSDEDLVEINADKTEIRRNPEKPIPVYNEERRKEIASRTAYVKGFPLNIEMSELIDFFYPFEKVLNIIMRKYIDHPKKTLKFRGSVFVTFAKKEQCEEFINKEKIEFKETNLIRKWQEEYFEEKRKEYAARKKKKSQEEEENVDLPKGTVLHFEGCNDSTTRQEIREAFQNDGAEVAFIDYMEGKKEGRIRFQKENSAKEFLEKMEDKKFKLNDSVELLLRTLTEEEEDEFLKKAAEQIKMSRSNQNKNKNNQKNQSKKGRKRKARKNEKDESNDSEPPIKK